MTHSGRKKPQDKPAKQQDKTAKPLRPKTKITKKPAKKRTTESSEPNADADSANPDSEVELDSLGSFLYTLLTMTVIRTMLKAARLTMQRYLSFLPVQTICQHRKSVKQTGK
jgi:hypothetical protein